MTVIDKSLVINAPLDTIRAIYNNRDYAMQIYQNVYLWEPDEDWPNPGAKAKVGFKAVTMKVEGTTTSVEYEPDPLRHVYRIDSDATGDEPSHWEWTFEEEDGRTTAKVKVEYTIPGRVLGPALDKLFVERENSKLLQQSLDNLKALSEQAAS